MGKRFSFFTYENITQPLSVERDVNGNWFYEMFSSRNKATELKSYKAKLNTVLCNPALMKVFSLHCDLYSLGRTNLYQNNELKEEHFLYSIKKKPNPFQTWKQFDWDYKFWRMLGMGIMYRTNNVFNESTQLYWLNPAYIDFGNGKNRFSQFIFSALGFKKLTQETIKYTFPDGTETKIKLSELSFFFDLSNGLNGNWFEGASRLDALYKIVANNEMALDAQSINLEFSQKFMVNGKNSLEDVSQTPMGDTEKQDIERSVRSNKKVHAVKTPIDVKRFVDDIARLKLDDAYFNTAYIVGNMFNTPKDILEYSLKDGSTFENQEKSMARMVEYCLKPAGEDYTDELESLFGFEDVRKEWSHLMFNQVFEKEKQEVIALKLDNEAKAKELGIKIETL